jgi:L-aminopeptidase/D-esterase-like protein
MLITPLPCPDHFTAVPGLRLGHAVDDAVVTGCTVIVPDAPAVAGVDVRGGAPGTRDTDALNPTCLVERVHGLCLAGGSVFGLAAADGVTQWLSDHGIGLPVASRPVPVVPSAILFDLSNGGLKNWGERSPYFGLGLAACQALGADDVSGRVGAGYGARAGSRQGGLGSAATQLPSGYRVGALVAINSFGDVGDPGQDVSAIALPKLALPGTNTSIGVVATDAPLTKAQAQRVAMMAHDGFARSIRPVHTPYDGDTLFALSTAPDGQPPLSALDLTILGTLAADVVARATTKAVRDCA